MSLQDESGGGRSASASTCVSRSCTRGAGTGCPPRAGTRWTASAPPPKRSATAPSPPCSAPSSSRSAPSSSASPAVTPRPVIAIASGQIAEFISPKGSLMIAAVLNIIGWLAVSFANDSSFLFMGRLLEGFGVAVISYTEPLGNHRYRCWGCGSYICRRHQDALAAAAVGDTGTRGSRCCHGGHGRTWKPPLPQVLRSLGWLQFFSDS